tara:strand:+ start:854 stop:1033 length:180 start_codon:yes stop_codon:yes gene_type:complete
MLEYYHSKIGYFLINNRMIDFSLLHERAFQSLNPIQQNFWAKLIHHPTKHVLSHFVYEP